MPRRRSTRVRAAGVATFQLPRFSCAPHHTRRRYYAQLTLARDKFPVSDPSMLKLSFAWVDTLRPKKAPFTQSSWAFEAANVLFNLGACEAQVRRRGRGGASRNGAGRRPRGVRPSLPAGDPTRCEQYISVN